MTKRHIFTGALVLLMAVTLVAGLAAAEDEDKKDKPLRGMVASLLYPGLTVGPDDKIRVDLVVKNTGRSNETVLFEVMEKPENWKVQIKNYGNIINGIFLPEDDDKSLTFSASPEGKEEKLPPGKYRFVIKAEAADGMLTQTSTLDVTVVEKEQVEEAIDLNTSYPILRGPSDSKFEFSLDVDNEADVDGLFNLSAAAPEGWEVSFKPPYEQKQISSLQIKANQTKSVGVEVTPARQAEVGEFPIRVRVSTGKAEAEVELKVVLTGTYKIKTGTPDGLLSVVTEVGKKSSISLFVQNEGSALQNEIAFLSFKPENWDIEFKPEKIEELKPGELKQVEVIISPYEEALVGDYSVAVSARGEKSSDEVEFRVTVKASSAWGWVGVALIVLVIGGLAATFKFLGRR